FEPRTEPHVMQMGDGFVIAGGDTTKFRNGIHSSLILTTMEFWSLHTRTRPIELFNQPEVDSGVTCLLREENGNWSFLCGNSVYNVNCELQVTRQQTIESGGRFLIALW